ncbi:phage tail fiber protein [Desulforamulus ruminis]|uniref:Uncharacterized protein n=1 Tax=Desulforamulus ruminis (strain ATCC 23193 / DSM 2154 / NCIMB 8452 / DL) TaxID=696281 RepID=F6DM29_DESRL|nr:hypothetical protein [Desulforamulus ruminis]AEG59371.1 hypothetical protein Desru_1096 [Desulforamulus ruminis DSM 2154]
MAKMSNYLENALINCTLRGIPYTPPSVIYAALFISDPTDADTGTEVSGGGYTRKPVTFDTPDNGAAVNNADLAFPVATGNWGTVTHIGLYDAETDGNLLFYGDLNTPRAINIDNQLIILEGGLMVTLD